MSLKKSSQSKLTRFFLDFNKCNQRKFDDSAVEPAIGHLQSDHRMNRCWLKGALGDALHCISWAAGYNVRWLLRAIEAKGIKSFCWLCLPKILTALQAVVRC